MKHSIICWDCSFRAFFHTIDGILAQEYPLENVEVIYVEQRTQSFADDKNHKQGLKSLNDRYEEVRDTLNLRVLYLNEPVSKPYHLGRAVRYGIDHAHGEFVSVMDGDLLLPSNFLHSLDKVHERDDVAVVNLYRHMASRPFGVSKKKWKEGAIDYHKCLSVCPNPNADIPETVANKGPMISAALDLWTEIGSYDVHKIWSTGLSRLGQDVTARMEIASQTQSVALPDVACVHPWHPIGFERNEESANKMLALQYKLIKWSIDNQISSWEERQSITEQLYAENEAFFNMMIYSDLARPGSKNLYRRKLTTSIKNRLSRWYRR